MFAITETGDTQIIAMFANYDDARDWQDGSEEDEMYLGVQTPANTEITDVDPRTLRLIGDFFHLPNKD